MISPWVRHLAETIVLRCTFVIPYHHHDASVATYGASLLAAPFAEWLLLRIFHSPRYAYLMISVLGALQAIYTLVSAVAYKF